jgi:hypothetical protein
MFVETKNRRNKQLLNMDVKLCFKLIMTHIYGTIYYISKNKNLTSPKQIKHHFLKYIKNQREELCLAAVRHDVDALKFVKHQTEKICLAAVRGNGWALKHVKVQTREICLAAIKELPCSRIFVKINLD